MNKENVYIIIPVHNRKEITLKCLDALQQNGDLDKYCILVVDDGSTDGTSEAVRNFYPDINILIGDGNLWWTGAIAMGMEYAYKQGAEYCIWLNDDCLVAKKSIDSLVGFCEKNANSIIGSQGLNFNNPTQIYFGGKKKIWMNYRHIDCPYGEVQACDLLSGNLVCIPRLVVNKIHYPNYKKVPHYGGDYSYLVRARKAGFNIFVDNRYLNFNLCDETYAFSPSRLLLKEGYPFDIIKLLFNPYSLYSWRISLEINQAEYGTLIGLVSFLAHYTIYFVIPILLVSILRPLPLPLRCKLSNFRRNFKQNFKAYFYLKK